MQSYIKYLLTVCIVLAMAGCRAKQTVVTTTAEPEPEIAEPQPTWHTVLASNTRATVTIDQQSVSANCTMQAVHDSLVVISVMPMLGIELYRLEATPDEVIIIDKMNRYYVATDYNEINQYLLPNMQFEDLQDLASGESAHDFGGKMNAALVYNAQGRTVTLHINYPQPPLRDVVTHPQHLNVSRFMQIDLQTLLQ